MLDRQWRFADLVRDGDGEVGVYMSVDGVPRVAGLLLLLTEQKPLVLAHLGLNFKQVHDGAPLQYNAGRRVACLAGPLQGVAVHAFE
jgi:hypothetical protein